MQTFIPPRALPLFSMRSTGAGGDDDDDELARELAAASTGPKSASDPIGLLVQLTALRSRSRSSYIHIKLPALLLLRQVRRRQPRSACDTDRLRECGRVPCGRLPAAVDSCNLACGVSICNHNRLLLVRVHACAV